MRKRNSLVVKEAKPVNITTTILKTVRDQAVAQHLAIHKTIADLEELSNEIDATLAFLKTRRGY